MGPNVRFFLTFQNLLCASVNVTNVPIFFLKASWHTTHFCCLVQFSLELRATAVASSMLLSVLMMHSAARLKSGIVLNEDQLRASRSDTRMNEFTGTFIRQSYSTFSSHLPQIYNVFSTTHGDKHKVLETTMKSSFLIPSPCFWRKISHCWMSTYSSVFYFTAYS